MATSGSKTITFSAPGTEFDNKLTWSWWVEALTSETYSMGAVIGWKAEIEAGSKDLDCGNWSLTVFDKDAHINVATTRYSGTSDTTIPAGTTVTVASGVFDKAWSDTYGCSASIDFYITVNSDNIHFSGGFTVGTRTTGAKILTAANFSDEGNPVITYSLDYLEVKYIELELYVWGTYWSGYLTRTDVPIVHNGTYTFELTDAERTNLRRWTREDKSAKVTYTLRTYLDDTEAISHEVDKVVTIYGEPTLEPSYVNNRPDDHFLLSDNSITAYCNATPQKEATIVSYSIACDKQVINAKSGTFTNATHNVFVFTVTDSRGYTVQKALTLPLIPYINPSCHIEAGEPIQNEGDSTVTMTYNISGVFYNGSFNDGGSGNAITVTYDITATDSNGNWYHVFERTEELGYYQWLDNITIDGNNYSGTIEHTFNYDAEVKVQVSVVDSTGTTAYASSEIQKVLPTFDWDKNDFNFNVPVTINGASVPSIADEGTSNGWTYRLWSDGTAECWCKVQFTTNISTAWGNLYSSGAISSTNKTFPFTFTEIPVVTASLSVMSAAALLMPPGGTSYTTTTSQTGAYELVRPSSISNATYLLNYIVRGRWK